MSPMWPEETRLFTPFGASPMGSLEGSLHPGTIAGGNASAVWPEANLAIYMPFRTAQPCVISQLFVLNGAAVSGNIDVGVYNEDFTRLVSSGSTAQAGTSVLQVFNITDIYIDAGVYYMGVAKDDIIGTTNRFGFNLGVMRALGLAQQSTAFALPAVATPVSLSMAYMPYCGFATRSLAI